MARWQERSSSRSVLSRLDRPMPLADTTPPFTGLTARDWLVHRGTLQADRLQADQRPPPVVRRETGQCRRRRARTHAHIKVSPSWLFSEVTLLRLSSSAGCDLVCRFGQIFKKPFRFMPGPGGRSSKFVPSPPQFRNGFGGSSHKRPFAEFFWIVGNPGPSLC